MPKYKHYTARLVERQIRAIIRRNPNNINPQDDLSCVYHAGRGPNIKRCLIGQWGFEQGFKTPHPCGGGINNVVDEIWSKQAVFDESAVRLMSLLQIQADGSNSEDFAPIPWRNVSL